MLGFRLKDFGLGLGDFGLRVYRVFGLGFRGLGFLGFPFIISAAVNPHKKK